MYAPNIAARDRVLMHMKAVIVGKVPLASFHLDDSGDSGEVGAVRSSEEWQPATAQTVLCVRRLSSASPALSDSDIYEAISFPGAPYVSIAFDDDSKLSIEEVETPETTREKDRDHFRFYKDDGRVDTWKAKSGGDKHYGTLPGQLGT